MQRKFEWIFEWIFDAFWRPKWMVWGAKMPLKINQKINDFLDRFLKSFWRKSCVELREAVSRRWVPGILNLPRIRLHISRHALLPQRGAADRRRLTATHRRPPSFGLASLRH